MQREFELSIGVRTAAMVLTLAAARRLPRDAGQDMCTRASWSDGLVLIRLAVVPKAMSNGSAWAGLVVQGAC